MIAMSRIYRPAVPILIGALLGAGCSTVGPRGPTEAVRGQLGTIGVVAPGLDLESALPAAQGSMLVKVLEGTATGALEPLQLLELGQHLPPEAAVVVLAAVVLMMPPSAALGGIDAGLDPDAEAVTHETEARLRQALAELDHKMLESMVSRFLLEARARTNHELVALTDPGAVSTFGVDDHPGHSGQAVDTYLDITVESVELVDKLGHATDFTLSLSTRVRLTRADDGEILYEKVYSTESWKALSLEDWNAERARTFEREWRRSIGRTAAAMVNELFLWYWLS